MNSWIVAARKRVKALKDGAFGLGHLEPKCPESSLRVLEFLGGVFFFAKQANLLKSTSKSCGISFADLCDGFDDKCEFSSTKLTVELPNAARSQLHGNSVNMFPLCEDKGLDDVIEADVGNVPRGDGRTGDQAKPYSPRRVICRLTIAVCACTYQVCDSLTLDKTVNQSRCSCGKWAPQVCFTLGCSGTNST